MGKRKHPLKFRKKRVSYRINQGTHQSMLIKMTKIREEKILKARREMQQITYKAIPIRL